MANSDVSDEPPAKIKREAEVKTECSSEVIIKDEPQTESNTSLVNHRLRVIPTSWLQSAVSPISTASSVPTPSPAPAASGASVAEVKVKVEPESSKDNDAKNANQSSPVTPVKLKKEDPDSNDDTKTSDPVPCSSTTDNVSSSTDMNQKPPCQYGSSCYRLNAQHRQEFSHPPESDPSKSPEKPRCRYGALCYRKNEEHRNRFMHPRSPNNAMSNQNRKRLRTVASQTAPSVVNYMFDTDSEDELDDFYTDGSDEFNPSDSGSETDFDEDIDDAED